LRSSPETQIEIPAPYSRQKAIKLARENGVENPTPNSKATDMLYLMFMKIGATSELPSDEKLKESFLNDFWLDFYFNNHLCPGDIPFHIILKQFTTAMVQGEKSLYGISRKGNNQAAICQAFNNWVTRDDVRHMLYRKRDEMYPHKKCQNRYKKRHTRNDCRLF